MQYPVQKTLSSNQDAVTACLAKIFVKHPSCRDAIIQLNRKLDKIMKLLGKTSEKCLIDDKNINLFFRPSPCRPYDEQGNFKIDKLFELDYNVMKKVYLEVLNF